MYGGPPGTIVLFVLLLLGVGSTRGSPVYTGGRQQSCGSPQKSYLLATAYKYGAFVYTDEQGYPQGFIRDLIAEVCPLAGIHCRAVLDDNSNCWFTRPGHHPSGGQGLQGGWYDACAGYFATHERNQVFDFSMPFAKQNDVFFFIKKGSKFDPHDIRGKDIGFHPSLFTDDKCVARLTHVTGNIIPPENIKTFSTYEAIDKALLSGKIDATVRTVAAMGRDYNEETSSIIPVRSMPFHCAIHGMSIMTRKDSDFISLWNLGFMMLKESGRYHKLCDESLEKHGLHGQFECVD